MRLIDADALKEWSEIVPLTFDGGIDINEFDKKLKSMPTVDAVPVIRCKDCKHYNGLLYTLCSNSGMNVIDDEEDYCSWAERKEE